MKRRILSLSLCLCLLAGLLLPARGADAADVIPQQHYGEYDILSFIYNQGDCFSMQGMTLDSNYTYCAKVNTDTDASACIIRSSKTDGSKTVMINSATGGYYFSNLGHANALDLVYANGHNQMLVTAGSTLVRLTMSGNYLTTAGTYTATYNGAAASMTAVQIMSACDQEIKVLVKTGRTLYTGTLDPSVSSGNIELTTLCTLNLSSVRLKGATYDFSGYVQQGFDFHDNKVFLPLSSNTSVNTSIVLVYDLEGAVGDIRNDPTLSFRVISSAYSALFEIEDVAVCQETGRLYFNTNSRVTDNDTNYDACCYFLDYVYDPAMSTTGPADYRWETVNNELISSTTGGGVYNLPTQFHGSITDNVMTHGLYSLSRSVILEHDAPWIVEWKSSGSFAGGAMLLASGKNSKVPNQPFLFRYKESHLISLGYYTGSQHNNYGIKLSDHGIDGTAEHVYRLTNKVATDGSNMVYLSVDGKELGAMNNYYIGINAQGTTSNWVSGQDFTFSYIGAYNHPLTDCKLDYLQVWADGVAKDEPDVFEWTSSGDQLTAVTGGGLTQNNATLYSGSVSGSTYTNACFRLEKPLVLLHDRPWSFEWTSEGSISGGTFLLSAAEGGMTKNAPFLFRYGNSGLIAIGVHDGTRHNNYGLNLSDHGIDSTLSHTYRLTNKIESDGSNMVYLYVDDALLGPMNNHYSGLNSLGTTSDWLSGKDFVFDYMGNMAYAMKGNYSNIRLSEEGKTSYLVEFRDYNGALLSSRYYTYGQTVEVPATPVRKADAKYTYTFAGWSPAVTSVVADAYYIATYTSTLNTYTITFQNDDGTILWSGQVPYGELPTAPADPTKEGSGGTSYTFTGWDQEITKVKGDAVYTAQYEAQTDTYTILFKDADGTVLSTQILNYGETPVAPAAPSKAPTVSHSYSFVGWDAAIVPANADAVYTARYVASLRKYTVTFQNTDGTVLSTQLVPYGYEATAPTAVPTRTPDSEYHYSFKGWSPALGAIAGDTVYTASYISTAHRYSSSTVAATCTASGKTTYTCTTCGYSYSKTIAATGHSYQNGTCTACGVQDPDYVPAVTAPTIGLKYPSVSFEDVIVMNVYYSASDLQDVAEMGLITYSYEASSYGVETAEHVVPGYTWSAADGFYYSSTAGIAPKDIGDTIYFAVYARLTDGTYRYTSLIGYSPKTYAMNQLKSGSAEMKPLVVAMLNYGAAAQTYFGYKTDALMNADLTADQKALVEDYNANMIATVTQITGSKLGSFINDSSYTKRYPTISFEGAFCINYYFQPSKTVQGDVMMYVWTLEDLNKASVLTKTNATKAVKMTLTETGEYLGVVDGIAAKDLDKAIYVTFVYSDGTTEHCGGVIGYTIGLYCKSQASKTGTLAELSKACAVYGYYAKQLFNK